MDYSSIAVSPAGAGMDLQFKTGFHRLFRFPRRRGDGPKAPARWVVLQPFPPQARGWTRVVQVKSVIPLVSPAGAGMDLDRRDCRPPPRCFPRRRGDGPTICLLLFFVQVFPPQARGWTVDEEIPPGPRHVSPAGAGMDLSIPTKSAVAPCFPRRRGDGPDTKTYRGTCSTFPPQARGWTAHLRMGRKASQVSPAGAGMDLPI